LQGSKTDTHCILLLRSGDKNFLTPLWGIVGDSHQLIIIYLDKSPVTFWLQIQENFVPRIKWQEWQRALNNM
jgi:hypothetical protein